MKVRAAVGKFGYGNLNQYVYGRAHDAIIGEWVRWWICFSECGKGSERVLSVLLSEKLCLLEADKKATCNVGRLHLQNPFQTLH